MANNEQNTTHATHHITYTDNIHHILINEQFKHNNKQHTTHNTQQTPNKTHIIPHIE